MNEEPILDHEKLDVYQIELLFVAWVAEDGKRQGKQRAKFFDDARGSAVECAACLDALAAKTLVTKARIAEGKALPLRIVGMLTKLVERFDAYRARENKEADD